MVESPSGECPDCGSNYQRLNQHWAMSECGPQDGAKKTYVCGLESCGETFEDYPTRIEARGRETFYCCKDHKHKAEREGEWVECSWCGDEMYKPPAQLDEMGDYAIDHHFCDKECEKQFKKANWVKQDHPLWKGGQGAVNATRTLLGDKPWKEVSADVRARDGHVCQMCGEFGVTRSLDVHHIIPVVSGGTNNPENLITLCMSCHRKAEEYTKKFTEPHLLKPAQ